MIKTACPRHIICAILFIVAVPALLVLTLAQLQSSKPVVVQAEPIHWQVKAKGLWDYD